MGTKFCKKIHDDDFQKIIIKDYDDLKSIKKVAIKNNITTRQIINILNDNEITHSNKRKIHVDEFFFDKKDDEIIGANVMYWAGFIAADGNVMNKKESRSYFLTIRLAQKDKNHLQKFKQCIATNAQIKDKVNNQSYHLDRYWKETYSSHIVLNSKYLVNSLAQYNIVPNKSKTYKFPEHLSNHKFINSFIRGYLDGDGCISFKKDKLRINFYGTQNCLNEISKIISDNCNVSAHKPFKNRSIYNLEYNGKEAISLNKWLYKNATIYLDRKYQISKSCE